MVGRGGVPPVQHRAERAADQPHGPGKRLTADDRLRAELELCDRWGIPHSKFIGIGDGTWTPRDREKALAYLAYRAGACPDCGTREEEWDADEEAYVTVALRCPGCEAIADRQADIADDARGVKVSLVTPAARAAVQVKAAMKAERDAAERRREKQAARAAQQ